jgi:hypothetical protein
MAGCSAPLRERKKGPALKFGLGAVVAVTALAATVAIGYLARREAAGRLKVNRAGAFFLAPVPAAVVGAAVSWTSGGWPRPDTVFVAYMLLIYAAQLLFGLAIRAVLLRTGRKSALGFALGGVVMIAVPAVPYVLWGVAKHPHQLASAPIVLALWLVMGGITGLAAWYLTEANEKTRPPVDGIFS